MTKKPIIGITGDYRSPRKDSEAMSWFKSGTYDCITASKIQTAGNNKARNCPGGLPLLIPPFDNQEDVEAMIEMVDGSLDLGISGLYGRFVSEYCSRGRHRMGFGRNSAALRVLGEPAPLNQGKRCNDTVPYLFLVDIDQKTIGYGRDDIHDEYHLKHIGQQVVDHGAFPRSARYSRVSSTSIYRLEKGSIFDVDLNPFNIGHLRRAPGSRKIRSYQNSYRTL